MACSATSKSRAWIGRTWSALTVLTAAPRSLPRGALPGHPAAARSRWARLAAARAAGARLYSPGTASDSGVLAGTRALLRAGLMQRLR